MHAQSVASNSALERQAFIRRQAEEIEALKIENAKLRRNIEIVGTALASLHGTSSTVDDVIEAAAAAQSEL